jgi:hypothetical protein
MSHRLRFLSGEFLLQIAMSQYEPEPHLLPADWQPSEAATQRMMREAMLVPDTGFVSIDLRDCERPAAVAGCA